MIDKDQVLKSSWDCIKCGAVNKARADCRRCGHEPVIGRRDTETHSHCDECHARVPAGRRWCDICRPRETQM